MTVFKNKTILQILDKYKDVWALSYASSVIGWDLETYMPSKGIAARGEALGRVSTVSQRLFLDREFVSLIEKSKKLKGLTDEESGVVRVLSRSLKFYKSLPASFLEEFARVTSTSTVVWRQAKKTDNFKMFEPHLKKVFDLNRKMAEYLGYKDSPYDALLNEYEEGLTVKEVESFFGQTKNPLMELLGEIIKSPNYFKQHKLEKALYDEEKLKAINDKILKLFWADNSRLRLDISAHPFTTSFSNCDTRITTSYHGKDFARSLLATVHEFGHALYDLQSSDLLEETPIGGGRSLVIHESQSRFWENFIGRSDVFIKKFLPDMRNAVGIDLRETDVYAYFNKVRPGLIRTEADEITYHFHIMLRFEIEKGIIEEKLKVKDIKEAWDEKMETYLGITPKKDSEGVLQDIHWSQGTVGYFPTYSFGTFLSAQWRKELENEIKTMDIEKIKKWLEKHVHKYGSTYTLSDILKKNDMRFDPMINIRYLEDKYEKIYGF